ncbi:cache domain-containing sensor histidine kinase [Paenibacillus beijingensis]|uniref:histidine kinase n=1 Tax=Paenibacillus beijingensis TaxID=1126833 RepID=A0A0D5NK98_9BACL|nr:sensor histidine kinase [Paenibacillus beijingensis]AJY75432.1 hypothetical protein VN24_13710 [Paenibacillus beijingensis]
MIVLRWKKYRDWRLKPKLLVFAAVFILGSLYSVTFISYTKYTEDFESQSSDSVQQIIGQVSYNIDTYLDDLNRLSLALYMNDFVMEALEDEDGGSALSRLQKRRLIEEFLDQMMIYPRGDINRVFIITNTIYSSGRIQVDIDDSGLFKQFGWYKQALVSPEPIFVPAHMQQMVNNRGPKVFSIVRQLRSTRNSDKVLGVIKVDANYTGIENIVRKVNMGAYGGLFIIDNKETVIYGSTGKLEAVHFYRSIQQSGQKTLKVDYNGEPYLLNSTLLPRSDWTIVAVNSLTELNAKATKTRNFGLWMALACAALAFCVLWWFLQKFLRPLLNVVRLMRTVERGDLNVRFPDKRGDEVGYLGLSFNALVSRIRTMLEENTQLVKQVYETELLQKEAQVLALHSQIKPHFIFNTLNMISLQMQMGKTDKSIGHIQQLSSILRSMTRSDKDITLQREIELLRAYLSIQSGRYEGRLDYEIDIDPSLSQVNVPALLFQPIVENAVIHGCETKRGKTTVRIASRETDSKLLFVIEDTGIGMDEETLERVRHKLALSEDAEHPAAHEAGHPAEHAAEHPAAHEPSRSGTGIGLLNVNKRIKLKYGAGYGLTVDSTLHEGTAVTVALPKPGREWRSYDV